MRSSVEYPEYVEDVARSTDEGKEANKNSFENEDGDHLQDSSMTSPTESGSISEDEGWLGGISSDFKTLALSLKETAGGVASFVHRSAVAVAAEIAQLEREEMQGEGGHGDGRRGSDEHRDLRLPWEVPCEELTYEEDSELKEKIQALSTKEETFLSPFSTETTPHEEDEEEQENASFVLDEPRIQLVRRILELDEQLAATHARLSGRSDIRETLFWRNYFYHCEQTRKAHMALYGSQDSLIPCNESSVAGDDSSFIKVPSPPVSASLESIDSLVVVDGAAVSSLEKLTIGEE